MSIIMYDDPKYKVDYNTYKVWDDQNIKGFFGEYKWLTNFHLSDVLYEHIIYNSVETAYQAQKLEPKERLEFSKLSPYDAKFHSNKLVILPVGWDDTKYELMYNLIYDKFIRSKELCKSLISTGSKYLEETNHWKDTYYGVDYLTGIGENKLGIILMDIREKLIEYQM